MLKINNVEYEKIEKFIDFDSFEAVVDGRKRKGKALYITLKSSIFKLGIETLFDYEWIIELKLNEEKDISKYIIGISYEDENGWMYLSDKCNCVINRIHKDSFGFNLIGNFEECGEVLNIEYDDILKIEQL